MIWNSVSEIWKFRDLKSFGIAYFRYFLWGKFLVSALEISNELRLSRFHFRWTRFSEMNNFRVEHFSKFTPEGPQNGRFLK